MNISKSPLYTGEAVTESLRVKLEGGTSRGGPRNIWSNFAGKLDQVVKGGRGHVEEGVLDPNQGVGLYRERTVQRTFPRNFTQDFGVGPTNLHANTFGHDKNSEGGFFRCFQYRWL